jgi:hypothetical protein
MSGLERPMSLGGNWNRRRRRSGVCVAAAARDPRNQPLSRVSWALLILFFVLQVADVVTTNHALAVPGNWEVNPLMEFAQAHLGPSWWIPKIAAAGLAAVVVLHIRRPWPIACAVSYYVLIVSSNLACL